MDAKTQKKIVEAQKKIQAAQKHAAKAMDKAQVQLKQARKNIDARIKTNPEEAVLIASAIGVAMGALAAYGVMRGKKKK